MCEEGTILPLKYVSKTDPAVAAAITEELARQRGTIELIASENIASRPSWKRWARCSRTSTPKATRASAITAGCEKVDMVGRPCARPRMRTVRQQLRQRPAAFWRPGELRCRTTALIQPGDKVLGMSLDQGGHLTHGSPVNFSGKLYEFHATALNPETETIDYDEMERLAKEVRPKLIVAVRAPIRARSTSSACAKSRTKWAPT